MKNSENARLATAVRGLAAEADQPSMAVQLHALAALLDQADFAPPRSETDIPATELELAAAIEAEDEERVIRLAHLLASAERRRFVGVDWGAASRG